MAAEEKEERTAALRLYPERVILCGGYPVIYLGERYILGYSEEDAGTGKSLQDGLFDKVLSFAGSCSLAPDRY